jgi:hypothetical protein
MVFNITFDLITGDTPWATPTTESIRRNFSLPWEWEDADGFKVNQFGHPYQGSTYFNAGRINGFNFYQSALFSTFGSFTWEVFGESNQASINDFITTVTGSLPVGEMLYRLYLEAHTAGVPASVAFFINPMAGFHRLITGWKPPDSGRNLYRLQYQLGTGYAHTNYDINGYGYDGQKLYSFRGPYADIGFQAIYGNPFMQKSTTPFDHFELSLSFGLNYGNYVNLRFISDGYLFSFSPVYTDTAMVSTGLSLHMDFVSLGKFHINDSTIDQYSNALNWTLKYQHTFFKNLIFQMKAHAGFTFMGVSEYYSPGRNKDLKNYGAGLNSKFFFSLEHDKLGKLEKSVFGYVLLTYPGTSALSKGTVYWLFTDITYSHFISKHLSLGVTCSLALEHGTFGDFPDTRKYNHAVKLFVAWNL